MESDLWMAVAIGCSLIVIMLLIQLESAITHTNLSRLQAATDPQPVPPRLAAIVERPERVLNPLRLVVVAAQLAQAALVVVLANRHLDAGWLVAALAIDVVVVFVLTETVPRSIGILRPERTLILLGRPLAALVTLWPIRALTEALIRASNLVTPGQGLRRGPFASPEDLLALADAAVEDDVLEQNERDLIESVIEFGDTVVREVMVPRNDMATVEHDSTVSDALELASFLGYSRLPVIGDNADDVIGLVYVKDLIRAELSGAGGSLVTGVVRDAQFVPETKNVDDLLRDMQQQSFHMAVAIDEYGGVAGLVTLEDLVEELIGEIVDEYDREEPLVQRLPDGSFRADGRISVYELNDLVGIELPEGTWDTVAGLVFTTLGRVPTEGETIDVNGVSLVVERMQGRRIKKVRLQTLDPERAAPVPMPLPSPHG